MSKLYLIFCAFVCSGFVTANVTGWSLFGAKASWQPAGPGRHGGHSSHYMFFHK